MANLSRPLSGEPPIGAAMFYRHFFAVMSAHHGDGECDRGRLRSDLDMASVAKLPRSWHLFRCHRHSSERHSRFRRFSRSNLRRSRVTIVRLLSGYWGQRARVGLGWTSPYRMAKAPLLVVITPREKSV